LVPGGIYMIENEITSKNFITQFTLLVRSIDPRDYGAEIGKRGTYSKFDANEAIGQADFKFIFSIVRLLTHLWDEH